MKKKRSISKPSSPSKKSAASTSLPSQATFEEAVVEAWRHEWPHIVVIAITWLIQAVAAAALVKFFHLGKDFKVPDSIGSYVLEHADWRFYAFEFGCLGMAMVVFVLSRNSTLLEQAEKEIVRLFYTLGSVFGALAIFIWLGGFGTQFLPQGTFIFFGYNVFGFLLAAWLRSRHLTL